MGREYSGRRHMVIRQRRKQREKLAKLRAAYQVASDDGTKQKIVEKIQKIVPTYPLNQLKS